MLKPLAAALLLAAIAQPALAAPETGKDATGKPAAEKAAAFALDPLPYAHDALAPVIDRETMELHHGRHHKAYVDNLNKAVAADPALAGLSLEDLLARVSTLSKAVRDNGGGHWNHRLFWTLMAPEGQGGTPSPALLAAIEGQWGSLDAFRQAFQQAGLAQFGSGWAWLILKDDGKLAITATPNQDNPLMDLAPVKGRPILANDVWEHAYYLGYRNRRGDYLSNWWKVVNWNRANDLFEEARAAGSR